MVEKVVRYRDYNAIVERSKEEIAQLQSQKGFWCGARLVSDKEC